MHILSPIITDLLSAEFEAVVSQQPQHKRMRKDVDGESSNGE